MWPACHQANSGVIPIWSPGSKRAAFGASVLEQDLHVVRAEDGVSSPVDQQKWSRRAIQLVLLQKKEIRCVLDSVLNSVKADCRRRRLCQPEVISAELSLLDPRGLVVCIRHAFYR